MSVANFIPEITAAEIDVAYNLATVVIPTLTPNYDGEAKSGNAVTIIGAALPTVQDYKANGRKFTAAELVSTEVKILIDQEKIVPQRVDNIDRRQAAGDLSQFTDLQGTALAKDAEKYVIGKFVADGKSINVVGSTPAPVVIDTAVKAKTALRKIAATLDAAEVPEEGRYAVINPAFKGLLVEGLSDASMALSATGENALVKNMVVELYGLKVLWSANFAEKVKPCAVGYHAASAAFVSQLEEVRAVQATDGHADIISTLNVYGARVTRVAGTAVYLSGGTPVVV